MWTHTAALTGTAAGVPFLALPPPGGLVAGAPVVVGWHLMDPPRTETALAAALPLAGLEAWRIYLGLPLCGARLPDGGLEELMHRGYEDAVLNLQGPIATQAAAEFEPAHAELRERLGLGGGPVGLLGGSLGAAVAQLVLCTSAVPVAAAVLVSPLVQLRPAVDAMARAYGFDYPWTDRSLAVARTLDFVARADEIAERQPAVLCVVGQDDDVDGFRAPAERLTGKLGERYGTEDRSRIVLVPGMAHALADEPGIEAAAQTAAAVEVDRLAADWLGRHLAVG